ncbi:PREDICTED: integrin alpha-5-like [Branchiostoma belcheri]|uniref:Integrin alpha-5-like n=1 Tax=Branchiostoma belcheri TaxID=7741 RepID=A0A6P4ZHI9_BRABE|nr:PREDICTED: integrin alpha-5-like [Branchiostoma belcheri]
MFCVTRFTTMTRNMKTTMWWVWLVFMPAALDVEGFNLDVESRLLYRGPTGSGFGASLDFHRETSGGTAGLVVGAPFAQGEAAGSGSTGAVFRCPAEDGLGANSTCHRLPLQLPDAKPDQMMGATVMTSPIEDLIVRGDMVFGAPGSYLWEGISVAAGDLSGTGDEDYVIGGPRAKRIMGLLAAGFGSSLCVTDVNGDGRQDLLIGAPYFSVLGGPTMQGDVGRVYVYLCKPGQPYCGLIAARGSIRDTTAITGRTAGGRFGTSMVAMGDMDSDGFNDVAIGAPYAGKAGEGAVYIYRGSPGGLTKEPSLAIEASSVGTCLKSFGYSLSGGVDIDGNLYPDLAVGAFESDAATVFRSVPVIDVITAVLNVRPKVVDPETRRCNTDDGRRAACFTAMLCVEYGGHGVPDTQDFLVSVVLDGPLLPLQRAVLKQDTPQLAMSLLKRQTSCMMLEVHLKEEIRDKLTPISVEVTLSLPQQLITGQLSPVLRPDAETYLSAQVNMSRNCGLDDICVPDLGVQASGSTTTIYVGDTTSVILDVTVSNRGEESYESHLYVLVPEEVDYVGAQRMETNTPAMCSYTAAGTGGTVNCEVGNPLKADSSVVLQLRFLVANLNGSRPFLDFPIFANSSTPDDISTTRDNQVVFSAKVVVEADVTVKGVSLPRDIWLDSSSVQEEEDNQDSTNDNSDTDVDAEPGISQIKHVYEVRNHGPSDVGQTIATIMWPATTEERSITVTVPDVSLKNQQGYCLVDNATALLCGSVEDCYTISCIVHGPVSGDSFVLEITSAVEDVQRSSVGNMTQDRLVSSARVVVMDMPYSISPAALPTAETNLGFFDRKKVSKEDDAFDAHDRELDSGIQEDEDGAAVKVP